MFFTPVSEEEAQNNRYNLLEPGHYDICKIDDVEKKISQKGNPTIKLTLLVGRTGGALSKVFCYLNDSPKMSFLVRHLAAALGLMSDYENGRFDEESLAIARKQGKNLMGGVTIRLDPERSKEDGTNGMWPPQNTVVDFGYTSPKKVEVKVEADNVEKVKPPVDEFVDDIPF